MSTSLKIDDILVSKAMKLGKHETKKDAVSCALEEYISRHQQKKAIKLFDSIVYDKVYNYKVQRNRN